MALARFVVTSRVTITPDTAATVTAGEPGTGAPAGPGNAATVSPGTSGKYQSNLPLMFLPRQVIYADSSVRQHRPAAPVPGDRRGQPAKRTSMARMTWGMTGLAN